MQKVINELIDELEDRAKEIERFGKVRAIQAHLLAACHLAAWDTDYPDLRELQDTLSHAFATARGERRRLRQQANRCRVARGEAPDPGDF